MLVVPATFAATGISVDFVPLKYFFNGVQKYSPSDQQGFIYNGRTFVPLRFMTEGLGTAVEWDAEDYGIYVTSPALNNTNQGNAGS